MKKQRRLKEILRKIEIFENIGRYSMIIGIVLCIIFTIISFILNNIAYIYIGAISGLSGFILTYIAIMGRYRCAVEILYVCEMSIRCDIEDEIYLKLIEEIWGL